MSKRGQTPVFFRPRDLVVLAALAALAAVLWLAFGRLAPPPARACFQVGDRLVLEVPLSQEGVFSLPQLPQVVFEIREGAVAFIQSDCPDQICVRTGWLSQTGRYAACLPNGVSVRVAGEIPDAVDAVAGG